MCSKNQGKKSLVRFVDELPQSVSVTRGDQSVSLGHSF